MEKTNWRKGIGEPKLEKSSPREKQGLPKWLRIILFFLILGTGFLLQMMCAVSVEKYVFDRNVQLVCLLFSWGLILFALVFGTKIAFGYGREDWCIPKKERGQHLLKGFFCGFLLVTFVVLAARILKSMNLLLGKPQVGMLFLFFIGFALQSSLEECLFRGLFTKIVYKKWGKRVAIFLPSVIFGLLHMGNPNFQWISLLNTVLAGVFFAQLLFWKQNLLLCCGVHAGWNFSLGCVYGLPVSGISLNPLFMGADILRPELLGGKYGPEASILTTIVYGLSILGLLLIERKKIWIKK